ncbi:MAG: hypothetical protein KME21_29060 [Desmonostoc vinosum HA7617-LM4]|jgi:hypothetical protein|nr:hypothetical protein [Desmonostoc vinosum HA7617-LM4]
MSFTLLKGSCPVCSGTRRDCRQSNQTGLIFCFAHEANPANYIFRGQDKIGFGMWQSSCDAQAFSDEIRAERRREFLANEAMRKQQQILNQLSSRERDRHYREILSQLSLSSEHYMHLRNDRGFTSQQIVARGYRSVSQWQKVAGLFPSNLPGLLPYGSLNVGGSGILCPVRDLEGLIVALRLRLDDSSQGRYRWLTSATKKNPEGATPHLDGELPLAVYEPDVYAGKGIWMTEGLEMKPALTCDRLSAPVLGGGKWSGSPKKAKQSIEYLSHKYGTKLLIFCPDAGDVINTDGVPGRWLGEIKFFESLGYQCRVAWWQQITKEDSDIDELEDYSIVQFITPEQFKATIERFQIGTHVMNGIIHKPKRVNSLISSPVKQLV